MDELVYTYPDGWQIGTMITQEARQKMVDECHTVNGSVYGCLKNHSGWTSKIESGDYFFMGLYDPEGIAKSHILLGDADTALMCKADANFYRHYFAARMFDEHQPRTVIERDFVIIEVSHGTRASGGDKYDPIPETLRVRDWWQTLPLAEKYASFTDWGSRPAALDFLKELKANNIEFRFS